MTTTEHELMEQTPSTAAYYLRHARIQLEVIGSPYRTADLIALAMVMSSDYAATSLSAAIDRHTEIMRCRHDREI